MWKAGNVINRIGSNPPAVLIWDDESGADVGEARTIEAARIMAAAPAMLAALKLAQAALERSAQERGVRHLEAVAIRDAIALAEGAAIAAATGAPTDETGAAGPTAAIQAGGYTLEHGPDGEGFTLERDGVRRYLSAGALAAAFGMLDSDPTDATGER